MFYKTDSEFGITHQAACKRANVSAPVGVLAIGHFVGYEPTPIPEYDASTHRAVEVYPEGTLQQWDIVPLTEEELAANASNERAQRKSQIDTLKVTTSAGNTFDADEVSQSRMARVILTMNDNAKVEWIMADNTTANVTKAELLEALALACEEQTALWSL